MKNHRLIFRAVDRDKFNEIATGTKTIETRAATVKHLAIRAGDTLTFVCGDSKITKTVGKVEHFASLEAMFAQLPLDKIMPGVADVAAATQIYYGFPEYREKIKMAGIVAFSLA